LVTREQFFHRRLLTLDPVERLFKSSLDESVTKPLHGSRPTRECVSDTLIRPIRAIGIGLEQHLSTPHLLPGPFQLLDNTLKLDSFWLRQSNNIQLPHGTPPCVPRASQVSPKSPIRLFSCDRALELWKPDNHGDREPK
jgi:hypothetical protein